MLEFVPEKKTLILWYIYLVSAFLTLILILAAAVPVIPRASAVLAAGVTALFIFAAVYYLPRLCSGSFIRISDKALIYGIGVFVRKEHILPLCRAVFAEKITNPVSSMLGVCTVGIRAVGGVLFLPPVDKRDADKIIAAVNKSEGEDEKGV